MEYMSVKDAAMKWNISERYVQRYCTEKRIEGAAKLGNVWVIPADAQKPADLRRAGNRTEAEEAAGLRLAMPLLNTPYRPGQCLEAIRRIKDEDSRNVAMAEYHYFRGYALEASELAEGYLSHEDLALRLSACWIYAYANLSLNRIPQVQNILNAVVQIGPSSLQRVSEKEKALIVFMASAASTLLHVPRPEGLPELQEYIRHLPQGLRSFAAYVQAHYAYLDGQYGVSIGIAETALAMEAEVYPIPSVYLHLVATMGYLRLKYLDQAKSHLLKAWKLAKPDDMIEAFAEHHGLLGGLLEAVIRKEWPEDFRRIIAITYSFSAGWRKIHNPATGHDVADDLTTTEFAIAMLAAQDWSNKEISSHLGVSPNTVKLHISSALQKLGITQRKELARFMLK